MRKHRTRRRERSAAGYCGARSAPAVHTAPGGLPQAAPIAHARPLVSPPPRRRAQRARPLSEGAAPRAPRGAACRAPAWGSTAREQPPRGWCTARCLASAPRAAPPTPVRRASPAVATAMHWHIATSVGKGECGGCGERLTRACGEKARARARAAAHLLLGRLHAQRAARDRRRARALRRRHPRAREAPRARQHREAGVASHARARRLRRGLDERTRALGHAFRPP